MMKKLSLTMAIIFAAMIFCTYAYAETEVNLNGNLEYHIDYDTTTDSSGDSDVDNTIYGMDDGSRIRIIPNVKTTTGNFFFEVSTEMRANMTGEAAIDDAWCKLGTDTFDVQIGRFEAEKLFDLGEDVKVVEAPGGPELYEANTIRGRLGTPGQIALHISPSDAITIELGTAYGTEAEKDLDGNVGEDDPEEELFEDNNIVGIRPVGIFTFGPIEAAVGLDYATITPQDDADYDQTIFGYGGKVIATLGPATLGIEYAGKTQSGTDFEGNDEDDITTNSMGAIATMTMGTGTLGGGFFYTTEEVDGSDNTATHTQYHVSYAHPLLVEGVTIKYAIGGATADDDDDTVDGSAMGFRVRLYYEW